MTNTEATNIEVTDTEQESTQLLARVQRLEAKLEHRERQIEAMQHTAESLLSQATVDDMVRETLEIAIEVLDADSGSMLIHNPLDDTLAFRYVVGPAADKLVGVAMPANQGIAGRVFQSGEADITQKVEDASEHNRAIDQQTGYQTESMMTVPLKRNRGKAIGVMQILNAREPFDELDLEVLQVMASQASSAIENARLLTEARKAEAVNVIGDISHDIKNMLTPIQSGVWTLEPMLDEMFRSLDKIHIVCPQADQWNQRIRDAVAVVREDYGWILQAALRSAEKVQIRTKEIADAVKGQSAPPFFTPGNINDVMNDIASALRLVVLDARLEMELELNPDLPDAEFDHKQIYNAIYNLANNAIPETPPDGTITLRTRKMDDDTLMIQVQDTGKGIPPQVRDSLFTESTISTKPGGTGLGTRIVGDVVKSHSGKISVDSAENQGTTFTIILPLRHDQTKTRK
jgi:signal transduction histidine kinase